MRHSDTVPEVRAIQVVENAEECPTEMSPMVEKPGAEVISIIASQTERSKKTHTSILLESLKYPLSPSHPLPK